MIGIIPYLRYVFLGNLNGLPVGMQAVGRYRDKAVLLRIAYAAEQALERRRSCR